MTVNEGCNFHVTIYAHSGGRKVPFAQRLGLYTLLVTAHETRTGLYVTGGMSPSSKLQLQRQMLGASFAYKPFKVGLSRLTFFGLERRSVHEKY